MSGPPMSDRAVVEIKQTTLVDDRACPACHEVGVLRCHIESEPLGERVLAQWAQWECKRCGNRWPAMPDTCPQPRATCARSEDRQWLVVLQEEDGACGWRIMRRRWGGYDIEACKKDTGQDANEVLAQFLEGRNV